MKKNILFILMVIVLPLSAMGQTVTGYVYDAKTSEPMIGVNISFKDKGETKGTLSDINGYYSIQVPKGGVMLQFSYIGYQVENIPLVTTARDLKQNVFMKEQTELLGEIVVSAGRFEQKLSDITVSMEVVKPDMIKRHDPKDIRATLTALPGVDVTDKQPSIRSGSGWTYGVGSRSLVMVDGMSILTPGIGEINWNTIPMENIQQVEVIKGASSVLYGSSALNGIINVRTSRPGIDPETNISTYVGIYGAPDNSSYRWWSKSFWKEGKYEVEPLLRKNILDGVRNPIYTGLDFSHSRRIGDFDVSGGMNLFTDEGYREGDYNKRVRFGGNLTYRNPNYDALNYGFSFNLLSNKSGDFFIWRGEDQAYERSPLTNMGREYNTFYVDPFLNYNNPKNNTSHKFKGRFYYNQTSIVQSETKNLLEIINNMGVANMDQWISDPMGTIDGYWQQIAPSVLPSLLNGDYHGVINGLAGSLGEIFPNAKRADYVDLLAWVMNNRPLPIENGGGDWSQWLLNSIAGEKEESQVNKTHSYYLDYQFGKKFNDVSTLTAGVTYEHVGANSDVTETHHSDNVAVYAQYDNKFFDRLNVSMGARFEYYRIDEHYREAETSFLGSKIPVKPVFRGGLNYQLAEYSFLRASVGQGYRYPSITEKYVVKDIGGVGAYPNSALKPERGYNAEIGIKQGYKFGPFMGFFDVAGFYTYYKDMIEFDFGLINPDADAGYPFITNLRDVVDIVQGGDIPYIGVKFANVSRARIYGVDASINGFCDINSSLKLLYTLSYVYTEPRDVKAGQRNREEEANTDELAMKSKSNTSKYLKYRQKHTAKASFDLQWERFNMGTSMTVKSKTLAVDYFMLDERQKYDKDIMDYVRYIIFGDLGEYWQRRNRTYFTMDFHMGAQVTRQVALQFMINNVTNKEYSSRPMDVAAPRTLVFKANVKF